MWLSLNFIKRSPLARCENNLDFVFLTEFFRNILEHTQ